MNLDFPLMPLPYVLRGLEGVHVGFAGFCVLLGGAFALLCLTRNVKDPDRDTARLGYLLLSIAVAGWVLGAYILLAALAVAVIWFIGYQFLIKFVIWHIFIKNAIVAIMPEKSKEEKEKAKAKTTRGGHGEAHY